MLKPIHRVPCTPALRACQRLMQYFVAWLCSVNSSAEVIQANCVPPQVLSQIEGDWLWSFLQKIDGQRSLLDRAKAIADLSLTDKTRLLNWTQTISALGQQFQPVPQNQWPSQPPLSGAVWGDFQSLMLAFYAKGFKSASGLPYSSNGSPTLNGGVTYRQFIEEFRAAHRLNPEDHEVCVICGGPLVSPQVDHWVAEGAYPLLAICADNLVPICGCCNSSENKGKKPVHSSGSFAEWYHPYLRQPNGAIFLDYILPNFTVTAVAATPLDQPKVINLDRLLKLQPRWTREFKAEHRKQQKQLEQQRARGLGPNSLAELYNYLQNYRDNLVPSEPHYEVHHVLAQAMLDPARAASWRTELGI